MSFFQIMWSKLRNFKNRFLDVDDGREESEDELGSLFVDYEREPETEY